jgi:hypothetical protein
MRNGRVHLQVVLCLAAALSACTSTGNMPTENTPPTITSQPADRTVAEGETATFSVVATGTAPLSYQWRKDGMEISGARSSSYTTPPTTAAGDGATFDVIVSNAAGSATSGTATLTVNTLVPTASTLNIAFDVKQLQFSWTEATGAGFYRLLLSPDGVSAFTQAGDDITAPATSITLDIAVYAQDWAAARYALDACNAIGCTRSNEVTITAGMLAAIGYFKASNTGVGDAFGQSVAVSSDGNTLAVGAPNEASAATGIDGNQADNSAGRSGAVYVFMRSRGVWSQQAYVKASNTDAFDVFGFSVALSSDGNTLAVGAFHENSAATGIDSNQADNSATGAGAAYVFTRSSGVWSQQAYVKASNTDGFDAFGFSVALSGDGDTLAVGTPGEDSAATGIGGNQADNSVLTSGAVYVFTRSSGVWSQQAYVKASDPGVDDLFGSSVAVSSDGNTLAVGAFQEDSAATGIGGNQADNSVVNSGAVYVFTRSSGVWSQQAYVKASNTGAGDWFGTSIAVSSDGSTLAVGAPNEDSAATAIDGNQADNSAGRSGAVYVFTRSGGVWSQQAYVKASNTGVDDLFGSSVAVSNDGDMLAVGAIDEDSAATGIGGNQADNSVLTSGAAYVFTRSSGVWSQQAYVKASNPGAVDAFGTSVAVSGDGNTLAVGAPNEASAATGIRGDQTDDSAPNAGAAYLF